MLEGDPFSPLQWYARRIKAPDAHKITGGSPKVLVGVIDTGVDASHPDLNDNIDFSRSVSCVGGKANRDQAAWNDDSGHGTNVAGVIAAEANGQGIVGIAPNVKLAIVKASTRRGTTDIFLADAVVCPSSGRPTTASTWRTTATRSTAPSWAGRPPSAAPTPRSA